MKSRIVMVAAMGLATAAMAAEAPKGWWDSITLKGDIRYRYESIQDDSKTNSSPSKAEDDRERERVRIRLQAEAKINDNLKAVAKYQLTKNLQLGATYFMNDKIISDDAKTRDYSRLQFDLVMAF